MIVGFQPSGLVEVVEGRVDLALPQERCPTVRKCSAVFCVDLSRPVGVGEGPVEIVRFEPQTRAITVGRGMFGTDSQALAQVGGSFIELARFGQNGAPQKQGRSRSWIDMQRMIDVGQCFFGLALVGPGDSAVGQCGEVFRIQPQRGIIVFDRRVEVASRKLGVSAGSQEVGVLGGLLYLLGEKRDGQFGRPDISSRDPAGRLDRDPQPFRLGVVDSDPFTRGQCLQDLLSTFDGSLAEDDHRIAHFLCERLADAEENRDQSDRPYDSVHDVSLPWIFHSATPAVRSFSRKWRFGGMGDCGVSNANLNPLARRWRQTGLRAAAKITNIRPSHSICATDCNPWAWSCHAK